MLKFWAAALAAFLLVFVTAHGKSASANGAAALRLLEHRESPLDLEVAGDLAGVPKGSVRYIPRQELVELPQVTATVSDDANFHGTVEIRGVLLSEMLKEVDPAGKTTMIVAICVDQYHAHYSLEYIGAHEPILALTVNGLPPSGWPTNAEVTGASMGPFLISHAKFTPRFKVLAHEEEPQIPWGVVRLELRDEQEVLSAIEPRGPHAGDTSVKAGYAIAQQNCFRCHNAGEEGGQKSGRSWAVLAAWAEASPQRFAAYVRNPQAVNAKSQMAPSPQYDDATMQTLIAYFKTFVPRAKP